MKLPLDTSVLMDVLRRRNQRREFVAELVRDAGDCAISSAVKSHARSMRNVKQPAVVLLICK